MMSKKVIVDLSEQGIDKFLKKLEKFDTNLKKAQQKTIEDLANFSVKNMRKIYNNSGVKDSTPMTFYSVDIENGKEARMAGYQALYDEFGTGTVGAQNPHPAKGNFELNDYNSGKTIRINKSENSQASKEKIPIGGLYWTYRDAQGNRKYTQGIAAQKEGYDTFQEAIKKSKTYAKKRVKEVLDDFN